MELSGAAAARTPIAGEIRLAWWDEELEALLGGGAGGAHPALRALAGAPPAALGRLRDGIEARGAEFEVRPFATAEALADHLRRTDGAFLEAALRLLGGENGTPPASAVAATAEAFGLMRLISEAPLWRAAGRSFGPEAVGGADPADFARAELKKRLPAVRAEIRRLPARVFPAVAPGVLLEAAARGARLGGLGLRLRIVLAAARGRI